MTTYYINSAAAGAANGSSWTDAYTSVQGCITGQAIVGGDILKVHKTHANNAGASITWTLPESGAGMVSIICVDKDASDALSTGAVEQTGGNFAFNIAGQGGTNGIYISGLTLETGSGGSDASAKLNFPNADVGYFVLSSCILWVNSTNSGAGMTSGATAAGGGCFTTLRNCQLRFGATGQGLAPTSGRIEMYNCKFHASSTSPTTLFLPLSSSKSNTTCYGCDWTGPTNLINIAGTGSLSFRCVNCAAPTNLTTGTHAGVGCGVYSFEATAPATGPNILRYFLSNGMGTVSDDETVYLTSGSASGTDSAGAATPYSQKMTPLAACTKFAPLYTPWVAVKVTATGSKTISIHAADTEGAALTDSELWMEVLYMGGANLASSPQGQAESTAPLVTGTLSRDVLAAGSAMTDTAVAWTGVAENSTYTLSKTVTVDYQGWVLVRAGLGKATTNPVYIDPKITVA